MFIPMLIGIGLRWALGRAQAELERGALARMVYRVFLPALVLDRLWTGELSSAHAYLPLISALCVLTSLVLAAWIFASRFWPRVRIRLSRPTQGALILAASFGNFTYLGLPVLVHSFGDPAATIAIAFDLMASTPLLLTLGLWIAAAHGRAPARERQGLRELVRSPPLWALFAGLALHFGEVPHPKAVGLALSVLAGAVSPLMLVAVGMALSWRGLTRADWLPLAVVVCIQLVWMPAVAWLASLWLPIPETWRGPIVVEAAMPTMILGLAICDRFKLNSAIYAEAVTLTTIIALAAIPAWVAFAQG